MSSKEHDCRDYLIVSEDKSNGEEGYLECSICQESYSSHFFICWVRPYPHLSDAVIEKIFDIIGDDFADDTYGEVDIPDEVIRANPHFYSKESTREVESKGSYFYEFSDTETENDFEKKLPKFKRYFQYQITPNY